MRQQSFALHQQQIKHRAVICEIQRVFQVMPNDRKILRGIGIFVRSRLCTCRLIGGTDRVELRFDELRIPGLRMRFHHIIADPERLVIPRPDLGICDQLASGLVGLGESICRLFGKRGKLLILCVNRRIQLELNGIERHLQRKRPPCLAKLNCQLILQRSKACMGIPQRLPCGEPFPTALKIAGLARHFLIIKRVLRCRFCHIQQALKPPHRVDGQL